LVLCLKIGSTIAKTLIRFTTTLKELKFNIENNLKLAKRRREVKKKGSDYQAVEDVDDHLLPSAQELIEYKEVDPSLIPFLKERAQIEQEKRHQFNDDMVSLNKREQNYIHIIRYLALLFGFIIVAGAMLMSYLLITGEHVVIGTIFGGVGLLYVAYLFISVANRNVKPPKGK